MGFYKRVLEGIAIRRRWETLKAREKILSRYEDFHRLRVGRCSSDPHSFCPFEERFHMDVLGTVFNSVPSGGRDRAAVDDSFQKSFPILFELLTSTPSVNGKRRLPSTVTVVAEDGMFKAGVRDREHQVSLWVSSPTYGGLMAALEEALSAPRVDWRKAPEYSSRNRPKT